MKFHDCKNDFFAGFGNNCCCNRYPYNRPFDTCGKCYNGCERGFIGYRNDFDGLKCEIEKTTRDLECFDNEIQHCTCDIIKLNEEIECLIHEIEKFRKCN